MDDFSRKLPFELEAEQSVLGSVLIEPNVITEIGDIIATDDFYTEDHRAIYSAMLNLFLESKTIDIVTLIDRLVKEGIYKDDEQGRLYLKVLADVVPSIKNVKEYAQIVREKAQLRRLINACAEITDTAYSSHDDVPDILNSAEQKIFDIVSKNESRDFRRIEDVILSVYSHLRELRIDPEATRGTPSGFSSLDKIVVGFNAGDLVLVGARPGMGKTSFALNIATSSAKATKKAVAIFSLEMSCEQLVTRMISSEALIDSHNLRTGEISPEEWENIAHVSDALAKCEILIDDTTGITVTGMKAKLRRVKNLGLVVVDYLQLMQSDKKIDNRVQEVSDISRNLKLLAKELGVPVITCAQLSRAAENRTGNRPQLSDLRDSGAIEQDADIVMFLYRPDYYVAADKKEENKTGNSIDSATVIIAKNRHGSTGDVELGWLGRYTRFVSKDKTETTKQ